MSHVDKLLKSARLDLQDDQAVRWSDAELLEHLNEAQRALAQMRPDLVAGVIRYTPKEGARQELPPQALVLFGVRRVMAGGTVDVSQVSKRALDAVLGSWTMRGHSTQYLHYMRQEMRPREFLLYPPAPISGDRGELELDVALLPPDCVEGGDLGVEGVWGDALRHFVLYRAWTKDSEFSGNAQMAREHYGMFRLLLGSPLPGGGEAGG